MKRVKGNIQEQQNSTVKQKQKEPNTLGTATIADNRNKTTIQRKLKSSIQSQTKSIQFKKPKGSTKFQQIALQMGNTYGVDTSNLSAVHNSSFPEKFNAEATIQGNNIHFAPGMDTDYNIKHEVAHAIDNTLHGTPKGDFIVQGYRIDTTREDHVDSMAKGAKETVKKSNYPDVTTTPEIDKDMKNKSLNPVMQTSLVQCKTVLVGETHKKKAISYGGIGVQPSKLVAALITENNYKPLKKGKYLKKIEQIKAKGRLQELMELGREIWQGNDPTWGAENNLIGSNSGAETHYGNAAVHAMDERTHIEQPAVREIGKFFTELTIRTDTHFTKSNLREKARQNESGGDLILRPVPDSYPGQMMWPPDSATNLKTQWNDQILNNTGMFEKISLQNGPNDHPAGPNQYKHDWLIQAEIFFRAGLQSLMDAAIVDLEKLLDADGIADLKKFFNANGGVMSQEDINRLAHKPSTQSVFKSIPYIALGFGGYARSISQWNSIKNQKSNQTNKGYILGEAHVSHIENNLGPKNARKLDKETYYYVKTDDYKEITFLEGTDL